jgi:hypothetical protein
VKRAWAIVALCVALSSSVARADESPSFLERFSPDIEAFFIMNLEDAGSEAFEPGVGGAVHVEVNVVRGFGVHGGGMLFVLTPGSLNETYYFGTQLGLRLHLTTLLGIPGDGYIEAHWSFGASEGGSCGPMPVPGCTSSTNISAHGFDAGLGYLIELSPVVGLGPWARFQWMKDPGLSNPMFLSFGIALSLLAKTRVGEPIPDADIDGVPDHEDICPEVPIGRHPDPDNRGCPARDRDGDGLVDPEDRCPSESMWPHPTRRQDGCPMPDADGDTIPDEYDDCPNTFAPDGGDALREGCPLEEGPGY